MNVAFLRKRQWALRRLYITEQVVRFHSRGVRLAASASDDANANETVDDMIPLQLPASVTLVFSFPNGTERTKRVETTSLNRQWERSEMKRLIHEQYETYRKNVKESDNIVYRLRELRRAEPGDDTIWNVIVDRLESKPTHQQKQQERLDYKLVEWWSTHFDDIAGTITEQENTNTLTYRVRAAGGGFLQNLPFQRANLETFQFNILEKNDLGVKLKSTDDNELTADVIRKILAYYGKDYGEITITLNGRCYNTSYPDWLCLADPADPAIIDGDECL